MLLLSLVIILVLVSVLLYRQVALPLASAVIVTAVGDHERLPRAERRPRFVVKAA
jgi:hypothetical protein